MTKQRGSMHRHVPLCWAKLGDNTWPECYHPVVCHLIDVGQVTHVLWERVLRNPVRRWVSARLGIDQHVAGRWLAFWVAAHDIGKVTPGFQFQGKTDALKTHLDSCGFNFPSGKPPHHGSTGTAILSAELPSFCNSSKLFCDNVAVAVGGHHGVFPTNCDKHGDALGNEFWKSIRKEILCELARLLGVPNLLKPHSHETSDQSVWMFLAGLTSVADWIGSNAAFFPPAGSKDTLDQLIDLDDYFHRSGEAAGKALDTLGWVGRAEPTGKVVSFAQATGIATPRPLQEAIIPMARQMTEPKLIIVEAPMGEGKTEAAWYVARCWDDHGGAGTYVALPTMATSNQMFGRVEQFLRDQAGKSHLQLLHGKASLNPDFAKLRKFAEQYDETRTSGVVAEEWFAKDKRQALLAPYGVGTIDQVLLAVLQTKHVFVRLFGLAGKCVILDEVHAYDAYMTTLMERLLRWLAALRCPVVLLSATLPWEKRLALIRAYAGKDAPERELKEYPRITTVGVGHSEANVIALQADPKRAKTIHLEWVENRDLIRKVIESVANGGCAAIIRNTVGLAQKTFTELREAIKDPDIKVELFHARFPFGRRQLIEEDVLARFGKSSGPNERSKRILVATQVIEQSLDLDFDVMFTDVAPVDLVLQRAGRLHRHDRGERGKPTLWLIQPGEKDEAGVPKFGDSEFVYARFVLLKSFVALKAKKTVTLPDDLETLVEQIYGKESLETPEHYCNDLAKSETVMREEQRKQNRGAKGVMIWPPEMEDLLEQPNQQLEEDDPEAHKKVQAATRDTEPTVQLILVYHLDGNDFLDPEGKEPFDETEVPDVKRLRQLLNNEVTISHMSCVFHYVNQPVPTGWKKSGMLRYHRLLRIGAEGRSLTDDRIRVDRELGVLTDRNRAVEES